MTLPAGIRENISHFESTLPIQWLLDRRIDCVGSIIDSAEPGVWAVAQQTIGARYAQGIRTHLVWNSEGSGLPAWPAPHSQAEELYLDRWRLFLEGLEDVRAVVSATAGNEGSTPGWVDTNGEPITTRVMAITAENFARASAPYGVQPWATSIHTAPADAIELARAVRGLCYGVPYHPYFRSLRGEPSTPWSNAEGGLPNRWRFGTVEEVADLFASEEGYPVDVACMFDELGAPTVLDGIGQSGQAHFAEGVILFDHPQIDRCLYFAGPRAAVPQAEIDKGLDFYIEGREAEIVFVNADPGTGNGGGHVAAKYPEPALERYWKSIDPSIPFDISPPPAGLGIARHWAEDPYKYGPPVAPEVDEGNGNSIQLFAKRPIRWTPGGPEDVDP